MRLQRSFIRFSPGVVEDVLRGDVVVVVVFVVNHRWRVGLLGKFVAKVTAVIVEVEGTAGTADTASRSADAAGVVTVVVQAEQCLFLRQLLLRYVNLSSAL
jgi:hypothetical protein